MVKALTFHHKKYGGTHPYLRILLKSFKLTTRCSLQRIYNKFSRTIMKKYRTDKRLFEWEKIGNYKTRC